jgi:phage virion morphogenesis protein
MPFEGQVDDRRFKRKIARLIDIATKTGPIMRKISGEMLGAVETYFREEGRPRWKKLKPSTIEARKRKGKWPGKILQVTGGLAASIQASHTRTEAIVGTNRTYAKFLQLGTRHMVARRFLKLTPKDLDDIKRLIKFDFTHGVEVL